MERNFGVDVIPIAPSGIICNSYDGSYKLEKSRNFMKYVVLPFLFPANGRIRTSNSGARENISSRLEAIFVNSKNEGYSKGLSQTVQYLRLTRFEVHIPEPARESLFAGQRGFSANS